MKMKPLTKTVGPVRRLATTWGVLAGLALASGQAASADVAVCTFKVERVAVGTDGTVVILAGIGSWWYMCNVSQTVTVYTYPGQAGARDIAPSVCQTWLANFMTAMAADQDVTIYADFSSNPAPVCGSGVLGSWAFPNPFPYWMEFG